MLIKRGDRDHNGRISFEDFYALMTAPVGQLI